MVTRAAREPNSSFPNDSASQEADMKTTTTTITMRYAAGAR